MAKIPVHYMGSLFHPDSVQMTISCRTQDGKKAWGLDINLEFEYKDFLKSSGAKWDASDRRWYFVFANAKDLVPAVALITAELRNRIEARYVPCLGIEDGILKQGQIHEFFRANSLLESCF